MPIPTAPERMRAIAIVGSTYDRSSLKWLASVVSLACAIALPSTPMAAPKETAVAATSTLPDFRLKDVPNAIGLLGKLRLPAWVIVISVDALDDDNHIVLRFPKGKDIIYNLSILLLFHATVQTPAQNDPGGDYTMSNSSLALVTPPAIYDKKVLFVYLGKGPMTLTLLSSIGQPLVTIKGSRSPLSRRRYGGEIHLVDRIHMIGHVDIAETILSIFHHQDIELTTIPIYGKILIISPLLSNTVRYTKQHGPAVSMELGIMLKLHVHGLENPMFLSVSLGPEVHFTGRVGAALNAIFNVPI